MRAVTVSEYGGAPALTDMPDPHPGPGEVLIKIQAAGMNPMDRNLANGAMKATTPASFPFILGSDLAGVVEAVGEGAGAVAEEPPEHPAMEQSRANAVPKASAAFFIERFYVHHRRRMMNLSARACPDSNFRRGRWRRLCPRYNC